MNISHLNHSRKLRRWGICNDREDRSSGENSTQAVREEDHHLATKIVKAGCLRVLRRGPWYPKAICILMNVPSDTQEVAFGAAVIEDDATQRSRGEFDDN